METEGERARKRQIVEDVESVRGITRADRERLRRAELDAQRARSASAHIAEGSKRDISRIRELEQSLRAGALAHESAMREARARADRADARAQEAARVSDLAQKQAQETQQESTSHILSAVSALRTTQGGTTAAA